MSNHGVEDTATAGGATVTTAIFDLGRVVLEWNPRAAYAGLLTDREIDQFMRDIDFPAWNVRQDAGQDWDEAEAQLARDHPEYAHLASAYRENFHLAMDREVAGVGAVLRELAASGIRLLCITNISEELFRNAYKRFDILSIFEGIVVSGAEGVIKPDPAIFRILSARYQADLRECVFIDDTLVNVAAARRLGLHAIHFSNADQLRADLAALGLPVAPTTTPSP